MSVPRTLPAFLPLRTASALLLLLAAAYCQAKGPDPPLRIPLQPLGFQSPGAGVLAAGGAMSTVHFIDEQHLLVTFSVRRLMKRMSDCPPDDQDRTVEAVVVHLPSGRAIARTHWRLHDAEPYLWSLGHGRFLLRVRDTLTTFKPLENLANGDPFVEQQFLNSTRKLAALMLSPDRDLVTIETVERRPAGSGEAESGLTASRKVQLNFYRILQPVQPIDQVIVQSAGTALAEGLINLSIISAGYIETLPESRDRWLFDFDPYVGKFVELSPFDSTCRPHAIFVSSSEFISFACRGSADRLALGGFNLRGEQMWQQNFMEPHAFPNLAFAPASGRFALSRNIVSSTAGITVDFAPSSFTTQEIRVYQTYNGKQLLRVEASPVQRVGQNYDLSPEGTRLAVIRQDVVEVHRLPALSSSDEAAVRAAKAQQPEDSKVYVNLASHVKPASSAGSPPVKVEATPQLSAPAVEAPAAPVAAAPVPAAVPPAEEPRKPPTLYTLPTDKPREKPQ